MRARFILAIATLLVTATLLAPATVAQSTPPAAKLDVIVRWENEHAEMELPETGRIDMGVVVEVIGVDFVCTQTAKYKVEIIIDAFPKWAGASMVPTTVPTTGHFEFESGKPGFQKTPAKNSGNAEAKLNIAWNLEDAPKKDAAHAYKVKARVTPQEGGPCSATPVPNTPWSAEMTIRLPDRPDNPNATAGAQVCDDNPFAPGCPGATATGQANDGGDAPGPDVLIILLGLVGFVGILRRNRN